jgi:hypothetical protein
MYLQKFYGHFCRGGGGPPLDTQTPSSYAIEDWQKIPHLELRCTCDEVGSQCLDNRSAQTTPPNATPVIPSITGHVKN